MVRFKMKCAHCKESNIITTGKYHSVLYEDYFKDDEILDFEEVADKFNKDIKTGGVLQTMYSNKFNGRFTCEHCSKKSKIIYNRNIYTRRESYLIEKSGNLLNGDFVCKLFNYLETKTRYIPTDSKATICEKEVFINKVWNKIKPNFINKAYLIKCDDRKVIAYLYNVDYNLGWGDALILKFVSVFGEFHNIIVNINELIKFEYIEVDNEFANKIIDVSKGM